MDPFLTRNKIQRTPVKDIISQSCVSEFNADLSIHAFGNRTSFVVSFNDSSCFSEKSASLVFRESSIQRLSNIVDPLQLRNTNIDELSWQNKPKKLCNKNNSPIYQSDDNTPTTLKRIHNISSPEMSPELQTVKRRHMAQSEAVFLNTFSDKVKKASTDNSPGQPDDNIAAAIEEVTTKPISCRETYTLEELDRVKVTMLAKLDFSQATEELDQLDSVTAPDLKKSVTQRKMDNLNKLDPNSSGRIEATTMNKIVSRRTKNKLDDVKSTSANRIEATLLKRAVSRRTESNSETNPLDRIEAIVIKKTVFRRELDNIEANSPERVGEMAVLKKPTSKGTIVKLKYPLEVALSDSNVEMTVVKKPAVRRATGKVKSLLEDISLDSSNVEMTVVKKPAVRRATGKVKSLLKDTSSDNSVVEMTVVKKPTVRRATGKVKNLLEDTSLDNSVVEMTVVKKPAIRRATGKVKSLLEDTSPDNSNVDMTVVKKPAVRRAIGKVKSLLEDTSPDNRAESPIVRRSRRTMKQVNYAEVKITETSCR